MTPVFTMAQSEPESFVFVSVLLWLCLFALKQKQKLTNSLTPYPRSPELMDCILASLSLTFCVLGLQVLATKPVQLSMNC